MKCQLSSTTIYYEVFGQGRPLLTISGSPADHRIIKSWLEPLFAKLPGWQRIYFDLPGTGQSPGHNSINNPDDMLKVICEFIDAILPRQNFVLLGLSYGGFLAQGVVFRMKTRLDGVCLLVPWLSEREDQPEPVTFIESPTAMARLTPEETRKLNGLTTIQSDEIVTWYRNTVIPAQAGADYTFWDRIVASENYSFDARAVIFDKPSLILTGHQDTHVGYKDAWALMDNYPRATFAVLDMAGHALGIEQAGLFHALITQWLERLMTGG